ncbi:endonuclease domain-containing protein [Permianibacter sp. IMCC34836]|uniref:endonuclease domain-containing protein n=1 Tax=Permianibacter fluminis TaxID=2738515 RepID=UPI0015567805|nr:DUF559 domain-containing protein [Permianibacter fluminis]NQD38574.1 endonuclease domain-containing protein [Permianibacter fluminis]
MRLSDNQRCRARRLRKEMTDAERMLWRQLRDPEKFAGKFRRQFPLGDYIVDFVCIERRLIIEVDGSQHLQSSHDEARSKWLELNGFRVIRFWNNEVLVDTESVCQTIWLALQERAIPSNGSL